MTGRLSIIGIALAVSVSTAEAQDYRLLPELSVVSGVAAGDTLNVRAKPTARSEDIGDLFPGQEVEILSLTDDRKWARIIAGEGNGWVAARFLKTIPWPEGASGLPANLSCSGTEPFWSLDTGEEAMMVFNDPMQDQKTPLRITWSSQSRNEGPGAYGFEAEEASGVLRRAQCSDGMSDRDYGWSLDLILNRAGGPELYSGCCSLN